MPQSKFLHRLEAARRFGPRGKVRVVAEAAHPHELGREARSAGNY